MENLPRRVHDFLNAQKPPDFEVNWGAQNLSIKYMGQGKTVRIGGWNKAPNGQHWYVNKSIADGHDSVLERYGFRPHNRRGGDDRRWVLPGPENAATFRNVVHELTGILLNEP